jgi:hypothetical protein
LLQRTVNLKIEEAYPKLKAVLIEKGYKVVTEEPPRHIALKQGSLWGVLPKTAKKNVHIDLEPVNDGTKISSSSKLAGDWKNITIIGCALAFVLVSICVWMATDLSTFMITRQPSFWSWLVLAGSNVDSMIAQAFVNLTWGLAGFLSIIIVLEVAIVLYVRSKIDAFTEEALKQLS